MFVAITAFVEVAEAPSLKVSYLAVKAFALEV